jgi:hypothetical protein
VGDAYLVDCYWPGVTVEALHDATARADNAARELSGAGRDVRFLCSVLVPVEEVAFCLFASGSRDSVEEASRRAQLRFDRVLECITRELQWLSARRTHQRSDHGGLIFGRDPDSGDRRRRETPSRVSTA